MTPIGGRFKFVRTSRNLSRCRRARGYCSGTTKTGLAYVTAVDFPDQVRHLIDDPSPVQRAQSAVLLVDQLDRFKDLIDELEAVVRIFLDHKHYVVLASKVHPGRLPHLSQGFRDLIDSGQIVQIVPRGAESQIETIRRQVRGDAVKAIGHSFHGHDLVSKVEG